jgi:hypothetical protein
MYTNGNRFEYLEEGRNVLVHRLLKEGPYTNG